MNRTSFPLIATLVFAVLAFPVLIPGQACAQPSDDEVLQRLRATYQDLEGLRARFTQQIDGNAITGTLVLSGDRYRIEMDGQVLVSDGTTAWAYSENDRQVLINHHIDDETGFSPNAFFAHYPEQFHVATIGTEAIRGARHDVLRLTPREQNAHVREVTLFVRSSDSMPTRVRLVDGHGATLVFDLTDIERNPRLAADTFRFSPPAGTEIVDLR